MKLKALGCQIYAGGFTLGLREHFEVDTHLELGTYGTKTAVHNLGVTVRPFEEAAELPGGYDLIYGNPPCAAWSQAGHVTKKGGDAWRDDPRLDCTRKHFSLLARFRPTAWVTESVMGAFTRGREFFDDLAMQALDLGYAVTYVLHDAQYLGSAQRRQRMFMVAHRVTIPWETLTFADPTPVGVLLRDVPKGEPIWDGQRKYVDLFPEVQPGEMLRKAWERREARLQRPLTKTAQGTVKGRPSFGRSRLHPDRVCTTLAGYMKIHPTEDRPLYDTELKRLAGYPLDYTFIGADLLQQLARGVTPPVAAWLGKQLAIGIEQGQPAEPDVHVLDLRKAPGYYDQQPLTTEN